MGKEMEINVGDVVLKWAMYLGLFVIFILFLNPIVSIPAGYQGIVLTMGASTGVMNPGLNFKIPLYQDVKQMETRTVKVEYKATAATKDLLDVKTDVAINYHIKEGTVAEVYQNVGSEYQDRLIAPASQEIVKSVTAKFTAEQLVTERAEVKRLIDEGLINRLAERNIVVETVSITNFEFPASFNSAIEAKQTAVQRALEAQNVVAQKEAEAKQAMMIAEGQANATKIKADAEMYAINAKGKAIRDNPQVITLNAIEKWNGQVPIVSGTGVMPFIPLNITQ